jgi:predicted NAD/FAD-binding protein
MSRLAIIGTGIAGLGSAYFLRRDHELTIFEQDRRIGGHAHTVLVPGGAAGSEQPLDTGFMVFNHATYPLLTRLFAELQVPTRPTSMSFSVRHAQSGLEYCGSSVNHLFAQRRNLLRPRFWRMLAAINRFNSEALAALEDPATRDESLGDYVRRRGYGDDFFQLYLIPMSSAVWSTPPKLMLEFPATTLLRFFHNHGFLGLHTQHQWWTVEGGSRRYVEKLIAPFRERIRLDTPVVRIARASGQVIVATADGMAQNFDRVILACHADEALSLLADPTADETRILREFRFQANTATVHTDATVMPRCRRAWASWNYEINSREGDRGSGTVEPATHYWMNSLQNLARGRNYFVSINRPDAIAPDQVLRRIAYTHPLFSLGAVRAQAELPALHAAARGQTETYFAGAWQRYGFHEDGLLSAHRLAVLLLGRDPWPSVGASA